MGANKRRLAVSRIDVLPLLKNLLQRREVGIEEPIGMKLKFLITFVEFIQRSEESGRIANVDFHRDFQLSTLGPDWVNTGIIYWNNLASFVLDSQPQRLVNLQAVCSGPNIGFQLSCG